MEKNALKQSVQTKVASVAFNANSATTTEVYTVKQQVWKQQVWRQQVWRQQVWRQLKNVCTCWVRSSKKVAINQNKRSTSTRQDCSGKNARNNIHS
nr:hypothetical protein BgiMline_004124 [Biomphalaria glabrata]